MDDFWFGSLGLGVCPGMLLSQKDVIPLAECRSIHILYSHTGHICKSSEIAKGRWCVQLVGQATVNL